MIYVDVNVFVYWLGDDPVYGEQATEIISRIERGERAVTSTLSLWLTHVVLNSLAENFSEQEFIDRIRGLIFLRIEPLNFEDFKEATALMKTYGLDLEDSLHLTTAMRLGADRIISNDRDFDRTPIERVGFNIG